MASLRLVRWIRALPIAWRIPLVVALNVFIALAVGALGWHAALVINGDLAELRVVQARTGALAELDIRASRLQGLIRQYLSNPSDDLLKEAMRRSEELFVAMGDATAHEHPLSEDAVAMHEAARRYVAGFQTLKSINANIARLYESQVLQTSSEMSGLYAILNSTARTRSGDVLAPAMVKSHENFVEALIAINVFYFDGNPARAAAAHAALIRMIETMPVLENLAGNELQRDALKVLAQRAGGLAQAINAISQGFEERARILNEEVGANQAAMSAAIDRQIGQGRRQEERLQKRSHVQLVRMAAVGAVSAVLLLGVGAWISWTIGQSIRMPLIGLRRVMEAGATGDWSQEVEDRDLDDELAAMAATVEVFKQGALERSRREHEQQLADRRHGEVKSRVIQDLLSQMEAHQFQPSAPPLAVPEGEMGEAAGIAQVFNRVLARFEQDIGERDATIRRLTTAMGRADTENLAKSSFLLALTSEIRDGLARSPDGRVDGEAVARLMGLAEDVGDFLNIEAGRLDLQRVAVPIIPLLADVARWAEPLAAAKGIRLALFVDPALPMAMAGDPARLRQILINLAAGAIRATDQGTVALSATQEPSSRANRRRLRLTVADCGPGTDPVLHPPRGAAPNGGDSTGLGLLVAHRLAELMGGAYTAECWPGLGSDLRVSLPLEAVGEDKAPSAHDLMGVRAAILHDDAELAGSAARALEEAGAAVVRGDGRGTWPTAGGRFDVLLISAALPVAAADQAGGVILALGDGPGLAQLERRAGWAGTLGAPLSGKQIVAAVAQVLGRG
jgi:signal transduction histidine kinase